METDILDGVESDSTDIIDGVERDSKESLNSKYVDTLEPDENCVPTVLDFINKAPEHAESNIKSDKNDTNTENDQADRNTILEACETKLNSSTSSGKNENVEKSSEDLEFKPHTFLTNEKTILDHAKNEQSFDSLNLNVDDRILSSEKLQKAVDEIIEEDMEIDSSDVPHAQDKTDPCELLKDSSLCSNEVKYTSGKDKVDKTEVKDDIYDIDNDVHQEATNTPSLQKLRKDQKNERSIFQSQDTSCQAAGDKASDDSSIKQIKHIDTNLKPVSKLGINKLEHSTQSKNSVDQTEKQRKEKLPNIVDKKNKSQKVVYVYSKELIQICDQMQKIPCRASMVHSLIEAYGLTRYMRVVEPREATEREVLTFHDLDYIEFIKKISNHDDSEKILNKVKETFRPEVVVCQCGADGLAGDPMESFNLTHKGLGKCLYFLLQWNLPTLVLGGGGYNLSNTARCWAFLTALATGKQIPTEIPDHEYFIEYGPDYELEVYPGNRKNHNTAHYLRQVYGAVLNNISKICTEKC
ncbi:HDAC8 [Mytilus edulis]|uniref:HDAC8 n=1 Tax=Mytilus edulis TaxID=6550 RepID=A0A8S3S9V3_MYTED|nr:HDAC8 [Mytilus edulis]